MIPPRWYSHCSTGIFCPKVYFMFSLTNHWPYCNRRGLCSAPGSEGAPEPSSEAVDPGLQHAWAEEHRDPEPDERATVRERPGKRLVSSIKQSFPSLNNIHLFFLVVFSVRLHFSVSMLLVFLIEMSSSQVLALQFTWVQLSFLWMSTHLWNVFYYISPADIVIIHLLPGVWKTIEEQGDTSLRLFL